jgi:iron complex transport system ATP-binding protein
MGLPDPAALSLRDVTLVREGRAILDTVTWTVGASERWVVLGRNGCGKSTLMKIASLYLHPSSGEVDVLGETLGRTDVRSLRKRIGVASSGMADQLRSDLIAADVVMTAKNAALETWWHTYDDADRQRARDCLERMEIGRLADRSFATLSSGEKQRVLLARTLMPEPGSHVGCSCCGCRYTCNCSGYPPC